ncbi:MAG: MFS transporter [Promethearchaeota archaeon]
MKQSQIYILFLLTLFSSALISIIMPLSKEITIALNLESEAQVAFINSMFLLVGAVSSLMWAFLADRFSRKIMLIIGTFIWSLFTLISTLAFNFYSLLIFQLIAAIGFGSSLPLIFSLLVDIVEKEKRGEIFGRFSATYVLGSGLGLLLSGYLIDYYPWNTSFIIIAIGGFICTFALFFMKNPKKMQSISELNVEDESVLGMSYRIKLKDLKEIWLKKTIFILIIFNFVMFIAIGAISSNFIPFLKNDYNFSSSIATTMLLLIFGSQMISGPIIGKLADKKYQKDKLGRIKIVFICLISASLCYIFAFSLIFTSKDLGLIFLFFTLFFIGAFFFGGIDPLIQATIGEISSPQIRSTVYSLIFLTYTIGRSISILLLAFFFMQYGNLYRPCYLNLSIIAIISSLFLLIVMKTMPIDLKKLNGNNF